MLQCSYRYLFSLLVTLNSTWASSTSSLLFVIIVCFSSCLHVHLVGIIGCHWVNETHCMHLYVFVVLTPRSFIERWRQQFGKFCLDIFSQLIGELDGEDQEEVAVNERVLVGRHALVLDSFHEPKASLCILVGYDVHRASFFGLLRAHSFFASALLEVCPSTIHHKAADVDAFSLQLRLARLLQRVHICSLCFCNIVERWCVEVFKGLPFGLVILLRQRVESLRHGLHNLPRQSLDFQLPAI
mmetsp:Transcript_101672/g.180578  ORF Transcript_101672/g.180578 Transcript_101672/m.180578 type:complete len:242 (-) Transcript_101672:913-1638(-)